MITGILGFIFIMLITVPFVYMIFDVFIDVLKRFHIFYRQKAKPVLVSVVTSLLKF